MAITASDIKFFKSTVTGSGGIASLGGALTANELTDALLNDLWDDVDATESTAGDTEYRCIYLQNKHGSLTLQLATLWIAVNAPNANVNCAIGLDPAGANATATTIADESSAPGGVVFTEPDSGSPFALGNLAFDEYYAFWIRRTVTAGAPASAADSLTLGFNGASDP
jgi:hypothetical protein